jgi:hypothetical protein
MEREFIHNLFNELLTRGYNNETLYEKYKLFKQDQNEILNKIVEVPLPLNSNHHHHNNDQQQNEYEEDPKLLVIKQYRNHYIRSISSICKIPEDLDIFIKKVIDSKKTFKERYKELHSKLLLNENSISHEEEKELHICYHLKPFIFI